ncbi:MAG TPA: GlxA family transcriptional regulator [Candidatus Competibacteraceae bacterium]|nr:GlxA family transcriptional regulator [Candidatus Competibacteraceae bacterium]
MSTSAPFRLGFLLLPGFSMMDFAFALEPLRMANLLRERTLYRWYVCVAEEAPAVAGIGQGLAPDCTLSEAGPLDALLVCGGEGMVAEMGAATLQRLRELGRDGVVLGAIGGGVGMLAAAGLLEGYRAAVHWRMADALRARFPGLAVATELFVCDRDRLTCCGGTAALDMSLDLIGRQHGAALMQAISEAFVCEHLRGPNVPQPVPLHRHLGIRQPELLNAVALMQANLAEPLNLEEIARRLGVSLRKLERLFRRHLQSNPSRYYLELRLQQARKLLLQSTLPIAEVARACGFISAAHFSTAYQRQFGRRPVYERRLQAETRLPAIPPAMVAPHRAPERAYRNSVAAGGWR